jgi:3-oxosteroid 1-dehydrogenase
MRPKAEDMDVLVIGSGAAGLTAALVAAVGGLSVTIIEKTDKIGGTSAMSGGGSWIPANHHAHAAGVDDSIEEALLYLRAASPPGWFEREAALLESFVVHAPAALRFIERETPVRFALTPEADPFGECPGAKPFGRMLSPKVMRRSIIGPYARHIRRSTMPHILTYQEMIAHDLFHRPVSTGIRLAPAMLWRMLTRQAAKGTALVTGLVRGCLDHGCRIELETRAIEPLTHDGRVTGAVVERNGQRIELTALLGVVLASGGFEWDAELLARHFPGPTDLIGSPAGNDGDGLRMALKVGAALANMDQANISPSIPTRYEGRLSALPVRFHVDPNAIIVDRSGRRFVSEYAFNIGSVLDERDPSSGEPIHLPAWVVTDRSFFRRAPLVARYARFAPGWMKRASTLAELAAQVGVPERPLVESVQRYNGFCKTGRDADFQRGEAAYEQRIASAVGVMRPIASPPYYAMGFNRAILGTKGGPRTNDRCEALRPDGSVIQGFYCAGAVMANPIGTWAVSAGTTLGPVMTWGYIAAKSLLNGSGAGRRSGGSADFENHTAIAPRIEVDETRSVGAAAARDDVEPKSSA